MYSLLLHKPPLYSRTDNTIIDHQGVYGENSSGSATEVFLVTVTCGRLGASPIITILFYGTLVVVLDGFKDLN